MPYKQEELSMLKANSSREGDVIEDLYEKDYTYANTVRGDIIDLEFEAGNLIPGKGEVVDYFVIITGYYHEIRTYLHPDADTSVETFEKELDNYVKEYNEHIIKQKAGFYKELELPYQE